MENNELNSNNKYAELLVSLREKMLSLDIDDLTDVLLRLANTNNCSWVIIMTINN
jgi:hypothetical protein